MIVWLVVLSGLVVYFGLLVIFLCHEVEQQEEQLKMLMDISQNIRAGITDLRNRMAAVELKTSWYNFYTTDKIPNEATCTIDEQAELHNLEREKWDLMS